MVAVSTSRTINEFIAHTFKAAQIADIPPWDEENFRYIMHVFEDIFTTSPCGFRTTNLPKKARDLDVRYFDPQQPADPYARALKAGILSYEGHPIEDLTLEVQAKIPLCGYGADIGLRYGFNKVWPFFTRSVPIEAIYDLTAFPPSLAHYADYFRKYGITKMGLLAFDYRKKTVNTYTGSDNCTPSKIAGMIGDLGFTVPPREILELNATSLCIYHTFSWESPYIERISFVLASPGEKLAHHPDPLVRRFAAEAPSLTKKRMFTHNTTYGRRGDYLKIEMDYTATMGESIMYVMMNV